MTDLHASHTPDEVRSFAQAQGASVEQVMDEPSSAAELARAKQGVRPTSLPISNPQAASVNTKRETWLDEQSAERQRLKDEYEHSSVNGDEEVKDKSTAKNKSTGHRKHKHGHSRKDKKSKSHKHTSKHRRKRKPTPNLALWTQKRMSLLTQPRQWMVLRTMSKRAL